MVLLLSLTVPLLLVLLLLVMETLMHLNWHQVDTRFPATLPAVIGSALTNLNIPTGLTNLMLPV